jgi:hypothetical protein
MIEIIGESADRKKSIKMVPNVRIVNQSIMIVKFYSSLFFQIF